MKEYTVRVTVQEVDPGPPKADGEGEQEGRFRAWGPFQVAVGETGVVFPEAMVAVLREAFDNEWVVTIFGYPADKEAL